MSATTTHPADSAWQNHGLRRIGGAAGLLFAASVIVQNLLRGAVAPPMEPSGADLRAYASDAAGITAVLTAMFAVNVVALGLFVGAVVQEVWAFRPMLAVAGLFGASGVFAMFALTTVLNAVVVARGADLEGGALEALWAVHDGAFAMNFPVLALALAALGAAGVAAGITPRVFGWMAPAGGALLVIGGAGAYAILGGSPLLFVGLAGFLVWLAFLVATGLVLLRRPA